MGNLAIGTPVRGQQHHAQPVLQQEITADQQLQPGVARRQVSTHNAAQGAFVGKREGRIAQRVGLPHQLLGERGAVQKGEIAEAVQLSIGRSVHGGDTRILFLCTVFCALPRRQVDQN